MHSDAKLVYKTSKWIPLAQSHAMRSTTRNYQEVELYHTHEYAELSFIATGQALHRTAAGQVLLPAGTVLLVRPEHQHSLTPKAEQTTIHNVVFLPEVLEKIGDKYFGPTMDYWANTLEPRVLESNDQQRTELTGLLQTLASEPAQLFYLDKFLLNLIGLFDLVPPQKSDSQVPEWLADAVEQLRRPKNLVIGLPYFYKTCSRTPNHVARYCRKYYGKTPGQILQRIRLECAASKLATTDDDITSIAYESGYNDLSLFYRHFKRMFNCPPAEFRKGYQRNAPK